MKINIQMTNAEGFQYISSQFSEEKQHFTKGEFVYMPEQKVRKIYFIHEGIIKIAGYNENFDSVTKAILYKGEVFNLPRLIQKEAAVNYAEVISMKAVVSVMNNTDFWLKIKNDVVFQYQILCSMSQRIIDLEKRWIWVNSLPIRERVIAFIVEMGLRNGTKVGFDIMVQNPFTHLEIGKFIGSSRQTVTTIFNHLQAENLIYYNRKKILIRDLKKLQESIG